MRNRLSRKSPTLAFSRLYAGLLLDTILVPASESIVEPVIAIAILVQILHIKVGVAGVTGIDDQVAVVMVLNQDTHVAGTRGAGIGDDVVVAALIVAILAAVRTAAAEQDPGICTRASYAVCIKELVARRAHEPVAIHTVIHDCTGGKGRVVRRIRPYAVLGIAIRREVRD